MTAPPPAPAAPPPPSQAHPASPAASGLVALARSVHASAGAPAPDALAAAADRRTRDLVDGFVHQAGPPPSRFAWVALGSHARRELHCASDQDHALIWQAARAAGSSYAADLAAEVIAGLTEFGMRPCDGGYMADRWSTSLVDWVAQAHDRIEAPTPQAVLDTDIFLDLRRVAGDLDITAATEVLRTGADSARLMHGLATAALSFTPALTAFGRLPHGPVDVKRTGLAPIVLLARLYGLRARSPEVGTVPRLAAAAGAGVLSEELAGRLVEAFGLLTRLRLAAQLAQVDAGLPLSDLVVVEDLPDDDQRALREAYRAVRAAQSTTAVAYRTDL
jgi:CBS domain-containing protein